jgi:hypothetical protein
MSQLIAFCCCCSTHHGELLLDLRIERIARHLVREHSRLDLDTVQHDPAAATVGMHLVLVVGLCI